MNQIILIIVIFVAILVALTVAWRHVSRRRALPCPVWLSPLLENPYVEAVASAAVLVDRANIGAGMRVLDAGCGPGRVTVPAAKKVGSTGEVVALDLQPGMLARLLDRADSAGLTNIRQIHGGLGHGLVEQNLFDRAFLITVLGEIPESERSAALQEIYDALKPGGILSITEVFPDPHYQSRTKVLQVCEATGFRRGDEFGSWLAFTINFVKQ
jgi:ubiquinone/menaquinone biosynthesis C-methylase UbiE